MSECLGFITEWFDPSPQIKRRYLLKYFPAEHQIEMVDLKLKRCFLKRGPAPSDVMPSQFYVGGQVIIHSRALSIVDYADPFTRSKLAHLEPVEHVVRDRTGSVEINSTLCFPSALSIFAFPAFYVSAFEVFCA